jgi:hypothetical protein
MEYWRLVLSYFVASNVLKFSVETLLVSGNVDIVWNLHIVGK